MPPRPRPERIAHRGAKREHRENTLPAFLTAVERGAEGIELDVHATADGVVVVHHDPVLGAGMSDATYGGRHLATLSAAELREVPFAEGTVVPTLAEVLAAVPPRVTVYVEVKAAGIEAHVARVIAPHAARVAVHAFDHRIARAIAAAVPGVPAGILQASYLIDSPAALSAAGARDLWQHWELIDAALVHDVHAVGGRVIAWTANDPEVIRQLAAWGVDGLCSDDLRVVREALGG
jgi:glycerophosphoryl diester phosphodiesterase